MNKSKVPEREVRRGDIYYADLPDTEEGSIQAGKRPVLITQCNRLNKTSTTVIVAIVTSKIKKTDDQIHVVLPMLTGLPKQSMVAAEQRKTISKSQLLDYRCSLDEETMAEVTRALRASESAEERIYRKKKNGMKLVESR